MKLVKLIANLGYGSRKQVVCSADGVDVAGKVKIKLLHGDNLRVATTCGTSFDTECRSL